MRIRLLLAACCFSFPALANNFEDQQAAVMAKNGLELKDEYLQCQDNDDCTYIRGTCGWQDVAVSKQSQEKIINIISLSEKDFRCRPPEETPMMARCVHDRCMLLKAKRVD